jgi:hypothetical protein
MEDNEIVKYMKFNYASCLELCELSQQLLKPPPFLPKLEGEVRFLASTMQRQPTILLNMSKLTWQFGLKINIAG